MNSFLEMKKTKIMAQKYKKTMDLIQIYNYEFPLIFSVVSSTFSLLDPDPRGIMYADPDPQPWCSN